MTNVYSFKFLKVKKKDLDFPRNLTKKDKSNKKICDGIKSNVAFI